MDLTTKENTLQSFLEAMKLGETTDVKNTMTTEGYKSLKLWVPAGDESLAFKYMGDEWSSREFEWKSDSIYQIAYWSYQNEDAVQIYIVKYGEIWKIRKVLME